MERGDALKYLIVVLICAGLIGVLLFFKPGTTGYAVYDFGDGSYVSANSADTALCRIEGSDPSDCTSELSASDDTRAKVEDVEEEIPGFVEGEWNISISEGEITEVKAIFEWYGEEELGEDRATWYYWDGSDFVEAGCEHTALEKEVDQTDVCDLTSFYTTLESLQEIRLQNKLTRIGVADKFNVDYFGINVSYSVIVETNEAPLITLISPEEGVDYTCEGSLDLNFSVSDADDNIDSCWYNLDNGNDTAIADCAATSFDISEGDHILVVYVNDTEGEQASDSADFFVNISEAQEEEEEETSEEEESSEPSTETTEEEGEGREVPPPASSSSTTPAPKTPVKIQPSMALLDITEIKQEKSILNISYVFDNTNVIGEEATMEIWVVNENEEEIARINDTFVINTDAVIKRDILIGLPRGAGGNHTVYFALTDNLDDFVVEPVFLEKRGLLTGLAVLDNFKGKFTIYALFLIATAIIIVLIWIRHRKAKHTEGLGFFKGH